MKRLSFFEYLFEQFDVDYEDVYDAMLPFYQNRKFVHMSLLDGKIFDAKTLRRILMEQVTSGVGFREACEKLKLVNKMVTSCLDGTSLAATEDLLCCLVEAQIFPVEQITGHLDNYLSEYCEV